MNSMIVEYIEGIEVIKAFGRAGVSYEKYARSITDYRTFVIQWLSSTRKLYRTGRSFRRWKINRGKTDRKILGRK